MTYIHFTIKCIIFNGYDRSLTVRYLAMARTWTHVTGWPAKCQPWHTPKLFSWCLIILTKVAAGGDRDFIPQRQNLRFDDRFGKETTAETIDVIDNYMFRTSVLKSNPVHGARNAAIHRNYNYILFIYVRQLIWNPTTIQYL